VSKIASVSARDMIRLNKIANLFRKIYPSGRRRTSRLRVAEFKYLRRRIELLEKLLDEKNNCVEKAKSVFLRNLYHEIRTPLNSIVGFSDLIEMNNLDIKEKESYITHIRESSQEFLNKMDNIIEASIIEAGLVKLSNEECMLYDLLTEIHSHYSLHKHLTEKNIALLLTVPDEIKKLQIRIDTFRLTQVLTNLITNAFKFTQQGVIEFGYMLKGKELEFFVKDTGIGGLEGRETEIFQNFTKLNVPESQYKGLGLGLSLSKKLIALMGGRIWYKSMLGKGTTFYFTIRYQQVRSAEKASSWRQRNLLNLRRTLEKTVVL